MKPSPSARNRTPSSTAGCAPISIVAGVVVDGHSVQGQPAELVAVRVPESVEVKPAFAAWMTPVPVTWPVKVALFRSPAGTRSPVTTPPVVLRSDQLSGAIFATKLFEPSRPIA